MKKLSVIVPVYRVEEYLPRCLDSILSQQIPDMEVLVVDDGSPDGCFQIMERYARQYPERIRIFQKENGGLSDARNFGMDRAQGHYIAFVDSDDYLEPGMYAAMLEKAEQGDFDMVVCGLRYVYPDRTLPVSSQLDRDLNQPGEIKDSMTRLYPAAWNKLYHRRLFEGGLRFQKGIWFEDVEFLYRLYPRIKSIGVVPQPFYQYVQRQGAITSVFDERLFDYLQNWRTILQHYRENGLFEAYEPQLQYCCMRYLYATFMKGAARTADPAVFRRAYRQARELVRKNFRCALKNPYFYRNGAKGLYILTFNKLTAWLLFQIAHKRRPALREDTDGNGQKNQ